MPITQNAIKDAQTLGIAPKQLDILETLLQRLVTEQKRQSIVTKITRRGQTIFTGSYGTNPKPYGVQLDSILHIASITKPIVATLLLILQEDGLIDINDVLLHYLPEFEGDNVKDIRLWHLLTHTSGIIDDKLYTSINEYVKTELGIDPPADDSTHEAWDEYQNKVCKKIGADSAKGRLNDPWYLLAPKIPMSLPPRKEMHYSNYSYQLLKYIIDAVTKEPIDQFAQRRLFGPLGMTNTYWNVPEEKWGQIMGREEKTEGYPFWNEPDSYQNESGSGGLKSTVSDMTRLMQMILGGGNLDGQRILSRRSVTEMCTNYNEGISSAVDGNPDWGAWGLGWCIRDNKQDDSGMLRNRAALDHGGWGGTKVIFDLEEDLTIAFFTVHKEPHNWIFGRVMNVIYSALA